MIKEFHNDDAGYKAWLRNVGGYVYNDFGGGNVAYKKLHKSNCKRLHNVHPKQKVRTSVRKICGDNLDELLQYIEQKRGPEGVGYSWGNYCFPDAGTSGPVDLIPQNSEHKAEYPLSVAEVTNTQDKTSDLELLAKAIRRRNAGDLEIARIIDRPAERGHTGEYIASEIFGITLQQSASHKGIDGYFGGGSLAGKSVNIKWYGKMEGILDITQGNPPDFYLVMTGPKTAVVSSKGTTRPWLISYVYLFDAHRLVTELKSQGVKIGIATSVRSHLWEKAEIYPAQRNAKLLLSDRQKILLTLFS